MTGTDPEILLVIFIHGFKGTDTTFGGFPDRLQHVLTETIDNVKAECIIFPIYETKGELAAAVERFAEWLSILTAERESELSASGQTAKLKIILCGHSMGGLLAADTLLAFSKSQPNPQSPIWPNIIACIAFDTPYFGISPSVFKNSATKAIEIAQAAHTVTTGLLGSFAGYQASRSTEPAGRNTSAASSRWGRLAPTAMMLGGALLASAAGTAAYYNREDLGTGYAWITDHMKYVSTLWDQEKLQKRMDDLIDLETQRGVAFRAFYITLPPAPPSHRSDRAFIIVPPTSARSYSHFLPARNRVASDELGAHTGMFTPQSNDGFYELGLQTTLFMRDVVMTSRGVVQDEKAKTAEGRVAGRAMTDKIDTTAMEM